jgi:hypothetical protein
VVVDTNVLFHKDKGPPVRPEFDSFYGDMLKVAPLRLFIPAVVRGEIIFQQVDEATRSLRTAKQQLDEVKRIAGSEFPITQVATIRSLIEKKFDAWAEATKATILPIPVSSIDWNRLCESAIWREAPFTRDPKVERGFRDALILETLKRYTKSEERQDIRIAWICRDNLLRATVDEQVKDPRFSSYEDIGSFSTHVKLIKEKLDRAFIDAILVRAKELFYKSEDVASIVQRERVLDKIAKQHKPESRSPSDPPGAFLSWVPSGPGKYAITLTPQFDKRDGDTYYWSNALWFGRFFTLSPFRTSPTAVGLGAGADVRLIHSVYDIALMGQVSPELLWAPGSRIAAGGGTTIGGSSWSELAGVPVRVVVAERLLLLKFLVRWSAKVGQNGVFEDVKIESIEPPQEQFRDATEEERKRYHPTLVEQTQSVVELP